MLVEEAAVGRCLPLAQIVPVGLRRKSPLTLTGSTAYRSACALLATRRRDRGFTTAADNGARLRGAALRFGAGALQTRQGGRDEARTGRRASDRALSLRRRAGTSCFHRG